MEIKLYKCKYQCGASKEEIIGETGIRTEFSSPPSHLCLRKVMGEMRRTSIPHEYELDIIETLKAIQLNEKTS